MAVRPLWSSRCSAHRRDARLLRNAAPRVRSFRDVPLIEATHPVKIYEYFAAGKPVVTTKLKELDHIANLCYITKDKEEFLEKLDKAVNEDDEQLRKDRIDFASKNTWDDRFNLLYTILQKNSSLDILHHN